MQLEPGTRRRTAVSLTPLIDVVFILLLFFMLTTQFTRHRSMNVTVPADAVNTSAEDVELLTMTLVNDGSLELDGNTGVAAADLADHPAVVRAVQNELAAVVLLEDDVELQTLTRFMDTLSTLSLSDVSIRGLN